jgi:hypothetical protein
MTAHCPLCRNPVAPAQRSAVAKRIAEKKIKLASELDALMRRYRLSEERAEKAAEKAADKAFIKGYEEGKKDSKYEYKRLIEQRKMFAERKPCPPKALLAKPPALFRGLRKKFPKDRFQHTQRGNAIIQTVRWSGNNAGCIVYTCKPDSNWLDELDTRVLENLKDRCRAQAGIQVVRSIRNNADGHGIFIICQKMALSFAAVVRQGVLLSARIQVDFLKKQEITRRVTV